MSHFELNTQPEDDQFVLTDQQKIIDLGLYDPTTGELMGIPQQDMLADTLNALWELQKSRRNNLENCELTTNDIYIGRGTLHWAKPRRDSTTSKVVEKKLDYVAGQIRFLGLDFSHSTDTDNGILTLTIENPDVLDDDQSL
ncbi:hypothetical protein GF389_02410, partial [Candidatus Dojkabacteria bacterium]|nr:hypothetical protein [Candidatus Dojkabacteria bacterium]